MRYPTEDGRPAERDAEQHLPAGTDELGRRLQASTTRRGQVTWYSVRIETRGYEPPGMTEDEFGDRLGDLVVALVPYSGVVVGAGHLVP